MWLRGSKKRLGGTVIYQAMGQTRQRELAAEVSNPRTPSQMGQRVKWANLVNLYRANRSWMKYAYETKSSNQSEYNKFMSLNVSSSRIYLTKQIANAGGCVVDSYLITQGSLPSIEFVPTTNGFYRSNIELGNVPDLDRMTVKDFSDILVRLNPAIRYGDQLSFIRMTQMSNASTGVPYVVVREYEVIIDTNNLLPLSDFLPLDYLYTWGDEEVFLAVGTATGRSGGFAMILSRTISGKTYVSSQRIITIDMDSYIEAFSSQSALQAAIDSYGVSEDAFLSSTYASQDNQASTMLAALYASIEGDDNTYPAGSRFILGTITLGQIFQVYFNSNVAQPVTALTVTTSKGVVSLSEIQARSSRVEAEFPESAAALSNSAVWYVSVIVGSQEYRIDFIRRNEDYQEGIE